MARSHRRTVAITRRVKAIGMGGYSVRNLLFDPTHVPSASPAGPHTSTRAADRSRSSAISGPCPTSVAASVIQERGFIPAYAGTLHRRAPGFYGRPLWFGYLANSDVNRRRHRASLAGARRAARPHLLPRRRAEAVPRASLPTKYEGFIGMSKNPGEFPRISCLHKSPIAWPPAQLGLV